MNHPSPYEAYEGLVLLPALSKILSLLDSYYINSKSLLADRPNGFSDIFKKSIHYQTYEFFNPTE